MTEPRYHVRNTQHGWSVVKDVPHLYRPECTHLGLAETLSEAVLIAQEDAGDERALSWSWGDDFTHGEGQ